MTSLPYLLPFVVCVDVNKVAAMDGHRALPALITVRGRSLPIFVLCRPYMVRVKADEVNVVFFSLNQVLILIVKPKNMLLVSSALALQKSPQDFGSQPPA